MVCLQSLGSSINVLKTLGPLFEAGFTGREDKPQAVMDAFQDYWDLTFAKDPVPKGGWPSTVITCLKACKREEVTTDSTSLLAETTDIISAEETKVPMLEPAFSWGSSSTIAADEDSASDVTMTSQDSSNSLDAATPIKEVPSTPEAVVTAICSPRRPSKIATIQRADIFSPLAQPTKLDYNFVMGTASPSSSPSRLPRSPLRSPKKTSDGLCHSDKENSPPKPAALPSLLDCIAMASSPGTPKLGKRQTSNLPTDSRPTKKSRGGHVARKSNRGGGGSDRAAEDDSEAEREEVLQSLLSPATPSSTAQRHQQHASVLTAFPTMPLRPLLRPCSRSPSPTPQPPQQKRKRKSVFMDAVEILTPRPTSALRKTRSASSHIDATPTTRRKSVSSASDEKIVMRPLSLSSSLSLPSGQAVRRSLRRAKSLVTLVSGADVSDPPPVGATPAVAQRSGKRQKVAAAAPAAVLSLKTKGWNSKLEDDSPTATGATDDDDDDATVTAGSSSPISAALKRARVLFGSGESLFSRCGFPLSFRCFALHCFCPLAPWTPLLFFSHSHFADGLVIL